MSTRRPWLYAVIGAVAATAAVIGAVALAGGSLTGDDAAPAAGPTSAGASRTPGAATEGPEDSGTDEDGAEDSQETAQPEVAPAADPFVVPVYYLGRGPAGQVLFREFHRVQPTDGISEPGAAAREAVSGEPLDPDYRTAWPAGTAVDDVTVESGVARVDLVRAPADRPAGLSRREAELAVQQLVWSVQGALQQRLPVRLTVDGEPVDRVLGVATGEPVTAGPPLETLSTMSITTPQEGARVGGTFTAQGVNNSFEATVVWEVLDQGGAVVADGFGTAEGYLEERLFPWSVAVDVSDLAPGTYTFVARNDDPSGGAEGPGAASDDRTIVVQ